MPDNPHQPDPRELERCEKYVDCPVCPVIAGVPCTLGIGGVRPDAHEARRIEYDVIVHAPRFWGAQLLASCLWDAWNSPLMTEAPLTEYTQAALARAQSAGMSIYRWVEENR